MEDWQCVAQGGAPQEIDVAVSSLVGVWSEHSALELAAYGLEDVDVAAVHSDLEGGLAAVGGEVAFAEDETDAESEVECVHDCNIVTTWKQCNVPRFTSG